MTRPEHPERRAEPRAPAVPVVTTAPDPDPDTATVGTPEQAVLDEVADVLDEVAGEGAPELEAEMDALDVARRVLFVHAHPDDETIGTGGTMARYAAEGAHVVLVTCTLGEEGEVLVPELAHLASDRDDALGQHRVGELATAMEALGVRDSRFLGGPGRYRDSGMVGTPTNDRPDVFWRADVDEAAALLADVVREVRPQVVVTYDENGGYGHPDHVQAHRVAMRAVELAAERGGAGEPWRVAKVYWAAVPRSVLERALARARAAGTEFFGGVQSVDELPFVVPDELVTAEVDVRAQLPAKLAAMRAHATQIAADGPFFAFVDQAAEVWGAEHYRLVRGEPGARDPVTGRETDLFSGTV